MVEIHVQVMVWRPAHHLSLRTSPTCAKRRKPAMCVHESYTSLTGIEAQLDKYTQLTQCEIISQKRGHGWCS